MERGPRAWWDLKEAQLAKAGAVASAEDQMIDDCAVESLGGAGEAAGRALVAVAWSRVAARVIVGEDDPGAAMKGGVGDDRAKREVGPAFVAGMPGQVNAVGVIVEMGDPKAFAGGIRVGDAAREECAGGDQAVQLQRKFGTLVTHTHCLAERERREDRNRVGFGAEFAPFWRY